MSETTDSGNAFEVIAVVPAAILCGGGSCPSVYRTDRGTYLVQGYPVDADREGIRLSPGEFLVEVPVDLLDLLPRHADRPAIIGDGEYG